MQFKIIPVNSGWGAQIRGTGLGGDALKGSGLRQKVHHQTSEHILWSEAVEPSVKERSMQEVTPADTLPHVTEVITRTAEAVLGSLPQHFPIVLGGDHSIAIGTWSAMTHALKAEGEFGLIWVDAHMDSHTFETSPSKAPHGMPVAALLGYGHKNFTQLLSDKAKINPKHLCLVGIRSFEAGEEALLNTLGVKIYYIDEVLERGFEAVMIEAQEYVSSQTKAFGISIDLDGFDPKEVPAVGSREKNGIPTYNAADVLRYLCQHPKLKAVEITEFNPERDVAQKTANFLAELICAVVEGKKEDE